MRHEMTREERLETEDNFVLKPKEIILDMIKVPKYQGKWEWKK